MANITHNATLDGVNDFNDLFGNPISWNGGDYIGFVGMFEPNAADVTTVNFSLTGADWTIEALRFGSSTDVTNFTDLDAGLGRNIHYLRLGQNSDVDLISTRVRHISGFDGNLHDITLGSVDTGSIRSINLYATTNIITTGAAWVHSIETGGADT
ncbi:MAG: hypothetical protein LJE68_14970, partial [Rhodobacter sp.]|nr:hypothetical protein [Rhodobacter sp.]